ncbi:MAG: restriction endonuclease subunit S [Candidatus Electrothrix sp. AR4]|nr:restriction endonuclease subunit S [Candidatus Electrothrix sp. AR4]
MQRFEKYSGYKDSGVDWIGEIPAGWEVKSIKHVTVKIGSGVTPSGGGTTYLNEGIPLLRSQNIHFGKIDLEDVARISSNVHMSMLNSHVHRGDVLLNITGGSIGRCHYVTSDYPMNVNQHVCIIRPSKQIQTKFLNAIMTSEIGQGQIWFHQQGGGREGLNFQSLKNFMLPFPPFPEQTAIANFLDEKTTKIDTAISQKEEMIALLKERKQILIQKAVTKGIDPDAQMKDSGVEWIGEIPESWEVKRFKNLFLQSKLPPSKTDGVVTSYRDGQVTLRSNRRMDGYTEAILEHGYQGVRKGQLVLNSMDAFAGAIGVSESDGKCTPEYVVCGAIDDSVSSEYFSYLLREMALAKYIQVICNAVRQRAIRIRFSKLSRLFFIVPPLQEQIAIVDFIETESAKIETSITLQQQQITKLKEYKSILIDNAVTGKIKVC